VKKLRHFVSKNWFLLIMPLIGIGLSACIIQFIIFTTFMWALAVAGWLIAGIMVFIIAKMSVNLRVEILKAKGEVLQANNNLINQISDSIEYFNGYHETMLDSVAIYSEMACNGVKAPVANSIISFAHEMSPEHTILLIGIDHDEFRWSIRVAGRPIHISQLKIIWGLVNKHLEQNAKPSGTLIVKKDSSIIN